MASEPEGTEPVNYKTWVLKVSIHCEGCKRKMKKILHKVKGVYAVDIDVKQNRATVTGNVDAQTLIQKLLEYGKHAELSPEMNPTATNAAAPAAAATTPAKGDEKPVSAASPAAATAAAEPETEEKRKAEKGKAVMSPETAPPPAGVASDEATAPKADVNAPSQPEKKNSEKAATADGESKKQGKVVKKEERKVDEREVSGTGVAAGVNSPPENPFPAKFQPLHTTVSYHAVNPTTSYAYYAAPPPEMPSNYGYYGNPPPPPPPAAASGYPPEYYYSSESYYGSMDQPSPSAGSYDMFNDENPNACKLM